MGVNILPTTSASAIPGVGSVVASGTSSKGYVQIPLAVGTYVAYVNTESLWGWHAPKSGVWGANYSSAQASYITITTAETIFTLGTRPLMQTGSFALTGISGGQTYPVFNGSTMVVGGNNGTTEYVNRFTGITDYTTMTNSGGVQTATLTGMNLAANAFISVANGVYFVPDASNLKLFRSTNAITWTSVTTPFTPGTQTTQVIYGSGNGYYALVTGSGSSATTSIASSTDGITWASRNSASATNTLTAIAYGNNTWVAVGQNGQIVSSTDSITWSSRTVGTTQSFYQVAHNGTRFVAIGDASDATSYAVGSNAAYSTDGTTWTLGNVSLSPNWTVGQSASVGVIPKLITIGNTFFLSTASLLNGIAISPDGINWGIVPQGTNTSWAHTNGNVAQTGPTIVGSTPIQGFTVQNVNGTLVQTSTPTTTLNLIWPAAFSYTIYAVTNSATN